MALSFEEAETLIFEFCRGVRIAKPSDAYQRSDQPHHHGG